MGFIEGPTAPKRIRGSPFQFQILSSLEISTPQAMFEQNLL